MFELGADEARLLLNVALMAVGSNRFRSAARILAALEGFRPNAPELAVSKAIALLSAVKYAEALAFIDESALRRFPGNAMLLAFRGLALLRLGGRDDEAAEALAAARAQTADPAAAQLAENLMKELR